MKKGDKRNFSVFNKLELATDFQPLVYFCDNGVGMFSKSVAVMMIRAGLELNDQVNVAFNTPFSNRIQKPLSGLTVKIEWYNDRFCFRSPDLIKILAQISPKMGDNGRGYYCAAVNVDHTEVMLGEDMLTRWEINDIDSFTKNIKFYKTHALAQMERHDKNRIELLNLLKADINLYNEWLFNSAYDYLNQIMHLDQWAINTLTSNASFWHWWKLQYYILDETVLFDYYAYKNVHQQDIEVLRSFYLEKHSTPPIQLQSKLYQHLTLERAKRYKNDKTKTEVC